MVPPIFPRRPKYPEFWRASGRLLFRPTSFRSGPSTKTLNVTSIFRRPNYCWLGEWGGLSLRLFFKAKIFDNNLNNCDYIYGGEGREVGSGTEVGSTWRSPEGVGPEPRKMEPRRVVPRRKRPTLANPMLAMLI